MRPAADVLKDLCRREHTSDPCVNQHPVVLRIIRQQNKSIPGYRVRPGDTAARQDAPVRNGVIQRLLISRVIQNPVVITVHQKPCIPDSLQNSRHRQCPILVRCVSNTILPGLSLRDPHVPLRVERSRRHSRHCSSLRVRSSFSRQIVSVCSDPRFLTAASAENHGQQNSANSKQRSCQNSISSAANLYRRSLLPRQNNPCTHQHKSSKDTDTECLPALTKKQRREQHPQHRIHEAQNRDAAHLIVFQQNSPERVSAG